MGFGAKEWHGETCLFRISVWCMEDARGGGGGENWRSDDKRDDENLIGGGCDGWELKRTS